MIENWYHGHNFLNPSSSTSGSSSSRSSHLSILTTTSSISSALSDVQPHSPLSPSSSQASGSKTHAFFGSPFSANEELQPPPAISRSSSVASSTGAASLKGKEVDADATPRLLSSPPPTSLRSLNDSFFSTPASDTRPTPPPSIRSFPRGSAPTSPEPSPPNSPPARGLAPLSRLFPSRVRYTGVDALPSRESSLHGGPPQPSPHAHPHAHTHAIPNPFSPKGRRAFVELDAEEYREPEPEHEAAPASPREPVRRAEAGGSAHGETKNTKQLTVRIPHEDEDARVGLPTPIALTSQGDAGTPPPSGPAPAPKPGDTIAEVVPADSPRNRDGGEVGGLKLQLVRALGQGAFSSVWLARDVGGRAGRLDVVRRTSLKRSKSKSLGRKASGTLKRQGTKGGSGSGRGSLRRRIEGALPKVNVGTSEFGESGGSEEGAGLWFRERGRSDGGEDTRERTLSGSGKEEGRLFALKMTDRSLCDRDDRTRVSFVREVEVLKHISHPSIVSYIHAFSTPTHNLLVLEHVPGGELFDLVSSPETHAHLTEPILRRIFGELCRAVGWMHAVALVHRDIKLENILLTRSPFASAASSAPLIKLTDFGLSRFIDPASPYLTTRCGSESYASPELVTGQPYDGRQSDAWACGVVLYALITRRLPFDAWDAAGHEEGVRHEAHQAEGRRVRGPRRDERSERRALLMRIAKGEYAWPAPHPGDGADASASAGAPLRGTALAQSEGVQRVVGRLLVRDAKKRARVAQLWEDAWMLGEGAPPVPSLPEPVGAPGASLAGVEAAVEAEVLPVDGDDVGVEAWEDVVDGADIWEGDEEEEELGVEVEEEGVEDEGVLVDEQDIGPGSVARQEH